QGTSCCVSVGKILICCVSFMDFTPACSGGLLQGLISKKLYKVSGVHLLPVGRGLPTTKVK
ncbi:MAG: hypothetical protein ACFFCD_14295, partial [Promethearchaeota archaeon]